MKPSASPKATATPAPLTLERLTVESIKPIQLGYTVVLVVLLFAIFLFLARFIWHTLKHFNKPMTLVIPGILGLPEEKAQETIKDYGEEIEIVLEQQELLKSKLEGQRKVLNKIISKLDSVGMMTLGLPPIATKKPPNPPS